MHSDATRKGKICTETGKRQMTRHKMKEMELCGRAEDGRQEMQGFRK